MSETSAGKSQDALSCDEAYRRAEFFIQSQNARHSVAYALGPIAWQVEVGMLTFMRSVERVRSWLRER